MKPTNLLEWKAKHPKEARDLGRVTGRKNKGRTFIAAGKIKAGPNNIHAIAWSLLSPASELFQFRNLAHFINGHKHLFSQSDLIKKTRTGDTNAQKQLAKLNPRSAHPRKSWKGWTWSQA